MILQVADSWGVAGRMGEVPGSYVAAALLPASIITVLFFFGALLLLQGCYKAARLHVLTPRLHR